MLPLTFFAVFVFATSSNPIHLVLRPGEVESLRCEITVRCVGARVCGFDGDVQ